MSETFLPGHGFPVGVVNFNYLTMDELEKRKALRASQRDQQEGKENFARNIEKLPSRDLPTALREYAPGADVVLGGKVYRSAGIMLGKVLASGQEISGDHQIPWFLALHTLRCWRNQRDLSDGLFALRCRIGSVTNRALSATDWLCYRHSL